MNSVNLIGRLVRDPEISYTPNTQTAVCKFTIAVDRPRRNGEDQGADFIRIVVYGKQGENCNRYLEKGRQVAIVNGRIQSGSYTDKETGKTVYTTDIIAGNVEFLSGGRASNGNPQSQAQPEPTQMGFSDIPGTADDDFGGFGGFED